MLSSAASAASRLLIARSMSDPLADVRNQGRLYLAASLAAARCSWMASASSPDRFDSGWVATQACSASSSSARVRVPSRQATRTG